MNCQTKTKMKGTWLGFLVRCGVLSIGFRFPLCYNFLFPPLPENALGGHPSLQCLFDPIISYHHTNENQRF